MKPEEYLAHFPQAMEAFIAKSKDVQSRRPEAFSCQTPPTSDADVAAYVNSLTDDQFLHVCSVGGLIALAIQPDPLEAVLKELVEQGR